MNESINQMGSRAEGRKLRAKSKFKNEYYRKRVMGPQSVHKIKKAKSSKGFKLTKAHCKSYTFYNMDNGPL